MPTIPSPALRRRDSVNAGDTFAVVTALPRAKTTPPADTLRPTPAPGSAAALRGGASGTAAGADVGTAPAPAFRPAARSGLDEGMRRHPR